MQYTHLGTSGLKINRIALGTIGFGNGSRETWALFRTGHAAQPPITGLHDLRCSS